MSDQLLIKQLKDGNHSVFESLFREYFKVLTIYAKTYVKDLDLAQGLTQEVFVKLYEKKDTLNIHTSFKSFLYTSVRNQCLDYIKATKIRRGHKEIIKYQNTGSEVDHSDTVLQVELQEKIYQIINGLPEQRQRIFKLSRQKGKSNQEIAEMLGISKRTVETHISNAIKSLKTNLKDYINLLLIMCLQVFI